MDYIRYIKFEKLFSLYNTIEALLESLQVDIESARNKENMEDPDDTILALCSRSFKLDGTPRAPEGTIADKTGDVVAMYKILNKKTQNNIVKEITKETFEIMDVLSKIKIAFKMIPEKNRRILMQKYWYNWTWDEIAKEHNIDKRVAQQKRRESIERMVKIARISEDAYDWIMKELSTGG